MMSESAAVAFLCVVLVGLGHGVFIISGITEGERGFMRGLVFVFVLLTLFGSGFMLGTSYQREIDRAEWERIEQRIFGPIDRPWLVDLTGRDSNQQD